MKLSPIVERLKGAGLKRVYGALELAGLDKQPGILPQYFVVPEGSEAAPNDMAGIHDQRVTSAFMVVAMVEASAPPRRAGGADHRGAGGLDAAERHAALRLRGLAAPVRWRTHGQLGRPV
jgi:hypothetical protein